MGINPIWPFLPWSLDMEHLNQSLFLYLNAGAHPSPPLLILANLLAEDLVWLIPLGLMFGWLRGFRGVREALIASALTGVLGLMVNQLIGLFWYHPRPFAIGIGHTLIPHVADSSFPSDHLTLVWSVGIALLCQPGTRKVGALLTFCGLPVAWARIFLGVHFPLDMLGSAVVGGVATGLVRLWHDGLVRRITSGLLPIHAQLFAGLIRRGWVRQ